MLRPGDITFCVLARSETNQFGRLVYASLGLARPADPDMYGYISELHGYGMTAEASGEQAEDLAATMLASTLGLEFDPDAAWNERKQIYEHGSLIIDSTSITATAVCGPTIAGPARSRRGVPVFLAGILLARAVQALLAGCAGLNGPDQKLARCISQNVGETGGRNKRRQLPLARTIGSRALTSPAICEAAARPRTEIPIPRRSSPCASSSASRSGRNQRVRRQQQHRQSASSYASRVAVAAAVRFRIGPSFGNDPVSPPSGGHKQDLDRPFSVIENGSAPY